MRKEDITVTTPLKSTIYAIGTRPENLGFEIEDEA